MRRYWKRRRAAARCLLSGTWMMFKLAACKRRRRHYFLTLPFSEVPDLQKSSTHDVAAAVRLGQGQQSHQRVALPRQRPQVADALAGRKPSVAFLRTFTANTGGQSQESSPSQNSRSHPVLQISQIQPHKPSHILSKHTEQAKRERVHRRQRPEWSRTSESPRQQTRASCLLWRNEWGEE